MYFPNNFVSLFSWNIPNFMDFLVLKLHLCVWGGGVGGGEWYFIHVLSGISLIIDKSLMMPTVFSNLFKEICETDTMYCGDDILYVVFQLKTCRDL